MEAGPTLSAPIRIVLDGRAVARAVLAAINPLEAFAQITAAAAASMINAEQGFRLAGQVLKRTEARRRRRARYEIREAILARRLGINPEPWRGRP